ncbi:long-chain-fatty-acid--CoA ligase heimdall-like [Haematobia irritans]|uniref:long-chain-fatty-acid--CoA ligase heimdall-like n=1 Tax=Haematobia irritans TaxID=7368 RepID=UPI003F508312
MSSHNSAMDYRSWSLHHPIKGRATKESLNEFKYQTISDFFRERCEKYANIPALAYKTNKTEANETPSSNQWTMITYEQYEKEVEKVAMALLYLGVPPRSSVAIMAFNCPEWFYIELAAIRINAVAAGIYTTNSAEATFHILSTAESSVVVVDNNHQMSKIRSIRSSLPQLRAVIQLQGPYEFDEKAQKEGYYRWSDLMKMNLRPMYQRELSRRELKVAPNDCALLIFTSGTVGLPKGVMLSHDNILYSAKSVSKALTSINPGNEVIVTYLPLSHVVGQAFDIFMSLNYGATVYFADCNALKGTILTTFMEVKPTMAIAVPRICEKFYERHIQMDSESSRTFRVLSEMAKVTMLQYHLERMKEININPSKSRIPSLKYWMASAIIYRLKTYLGLEHCKLAMVGGAPISETVTNFFLSLDLPLIDGFGLSETSGGVIFSLQKPNVLTIGKPLRGVDIKIHEPDENGEGELLIRSRTNFMGYLKEPEKTMETIRQDGYICTGDCGRIDKDGYVYITGRIKELIITSGGENMPPVVIEDSIKKELPCISNAVAVGDHRKYVTVLLTFKTLISPEAGYPLDNLLPETIDWLSTLDLHYTKLSEILHMEYPKNFKDFDVNSVEIRLDEKVHKALESGIEKANRHAISNAQRVQYFSILPHDFTIVTGELGPTMKLRRNIIHKKYAKYIDKMYS